MCSPHTEQIGITILFHHVFLYFLKTIYLHLDFTFYVIKLIIPLLGAVFVILLTGSIQSISADHTEPGIGIFKDSTNVNIVDNEDSKYKIFMHAVIRNVDGHLITTIENTAKGAYIPHKITDHVFDTLMGKKEIVTIDNIKYEKVQYAYTPSLEYRSVLLYPIFSEVDFTFEISAEQVNRMHSINQEYGNWKIDYCAIFEEPHNHRCIPIFQVLMPNMTLEPGDVVTHYWTILRELS